MPALFRHRLPRGRPKQGRRRNDKAAEIARAAIRMLAQKDFDAWSMSELARESGCSVGSLYQRFPDKYMCLLYAVEMQFGNMIAAANSALSPLPPNRSLAANKAEFLIDHIVSEMTAPSAAGAIRATLKLATIRPEAVKKFEEYRETLNDCAIAMLHNQMPKGISRDTIRVAVQIVIATVTDSLLQEKPGPMSAGSRRMKSALTNVFISYLGISSDKKWGGTEADDDECKVDNKIFAEPPQSGDAQYDPKEQGFRRVIASQTPKRGKAKATQGRNTSALPSEIAPNAKAKRLPKCSRNHSRRKSRTI